MAFEKTRYNPDAHLDATAAMILGFFILIFSALYVLAWIAQPIGTAIFTAVVLLMGGVWFALYKFFQTREF